MQNAWRSFEGRPRPSHSPAGVEWAPVNRRQFLRTAAAAVAVTGAAYGRESTEAKMTLLGNRFLTFNTVIRVNQIEAGRDQLIGADEARLHTPEAVKAFREAIRQGWPESRITWAFSWLALQDTRENYKAIREIVTGYHHTFGDEITFIPGAYFANMYNSREQVNRDLHDGLQMVSELVGGGYRPRSVVAGFLSAANHQYLVESEKIHVCQGNIWSQYGVDNGDGDGAVSYPYYPSREHFCKPAQTSADFIDSVNLDGWTCDFLCARRFGGEDGFNSRMGVGPIETIMTHGPETGLRQMLATTAVHFDNGFEWNHFGWVTNCWEASLVDYHPDKRTVYLESLTTWLREIRTRWPNAKCITQGEFGLLWRDHYKDNRPLEYRFEQRGSGIGGSDANMEIRWFMNKDFRLALLRDWRANTAPEIIDFTRYDIPAAEPQDLGRNWSLVNRINQKRRRPQDKPVPLSALTPEEQDLIHRHHGAGI